MLLLPAHLKGTAPAQCMNLGQHNATLGMGDVPPNCGDTSSIMKIARGGFTQSFTMNKTWKITLGLLSSYMITPKSRKTDLLLPCAGIVGKSWIFTLNGRIRVCLLQSGRWGTIAEEPSHEVLRAEAPSPQDGIDTTRCFYHGQLSVSC